MSSKQPTAAALQLLETTLNSFERLEVAIALYRAEGHSRSVTELSTELKLSSQIVERGIDELERAGVVQLASEVARLSLDPRDIPAMDEIAALYDEDRLLVVRTLTEIALSKMRSMAARAFADAFQLRHKKEDDGDA